MTHMNMIHTVRKWFLLFVAVTAASFAAPGFAKTFYAVMLDANNSPTTLLPSGDGVTIKLKVYNTSTEPATINSLVLCNIPGVTLTGVVANTGSGVLGDYAVGSEGDICLGTGGKTLTGFDGFKRLTNKTFQIVANVSAVCSGSLATWPIFASTGNVFSGTTKFTNQQPTQYGCDVVLASCSPPSSYTEVSGGNTTTIERLPKPGAACTPTAFNVFFTDTDNTVEIQWTGNVLLKTTTKWPLSLVNPQTTQPKTTWVAWAKDATTLLPIYIPVPACTSDQPPLTFPVTDPFPVISSTALTICTQVVASMPPNST